MQFFSSKDEIFANISQIKKQPSTLQSTMSSYSENTSLSDDGAGLEDVSTTLYFGNLHSFVQQSSLEDLCAYFGPVESAKVIKDKGTGTSAGYGFVKFSERTFAEAALQALHGKAYLGQELRVNWALPNNHKEDTSHHFHIFVGDLGCEVTDAILHNTFSTVGQCSEARVMWDHSTGRSKGYGFVSFRAKDEAEAAVEQMQGKLIGSRRIRVGWAQHKQEEGASPRDNDGIDRSDPLNTNVYIGNISPETDENDLRHHFEVFGPLAEIKLHKKGGYGFVRFEMHESAVDAIARGHGQELHGRAMKCAWGKSLSSSGSGASLPSLAPAPVFNLGPAFQSQGNHSASGRNLHSSSRNTLNGNPGMMSLAAAANMAAGGPCPQASALLANSMLSMGASSANLLAYQGLMDNSQMMFNQAGLSQVEMLTTQMMLLQNLQSLQAQQDCMGLQAMAAYNHPVSTGRASMDNRMMSGGNHMSDSFYGGNLLSAGLFTGRNAFSGRNGLSG